jgi:hypothetical protein
MAISITKHLRPAGMVPIGRLKGHSARNYDKVIEEAVMANTTARARKDLYCEGRIG